MFVNVQVQYVPIYIYACVCVCTCEWATKFEHRVFITVWWKYHRGYWEGSHAPTQGKHWQLEENSNSASFSWLICWSALLYGLWIQPNMEINIFYKENTFYHCAIVLNHWKIWLNVYITSITKTELVQNNTLYYSSRWQTSQPTKPLCCILWLLDGFSKNVHARVQIKVEATTSSVMTHPNDWPLTAFQTHQQSWSRDTSWCLRCLSGYSLVSPLKRKSHTNTKT